MATPRWLADEMVGRLARYLRFLGHDTEYVRSLPDAEIAERARIEHRRLLTRDRQLAQRVAGAVLLESPNLPDQLRRVRQEAPEAAYAVTFDRCSLCNLVLRTWSPPTGEPWPEEIPKSRSGVDRPIFACEKCGHRFWEGSHTERIRLQIAGWLLS